MIATGPGAAGAVRELAQGVDRGLLSVPQGPRTCGRGSAVESRLAFAEVERAIARAGGIAI